MWVVRAQLYSCWNIIAEWWNNILLRHEFMSWPGSTPLLLSTIIWRLRPAQNIRILFEDQSQRGVKCFIRYLSTLFDKMDTMLILVWSWCLTLSYHGSQVWCSRGLQHCEEHFHVLCGNSEQCRPRLSVYNALILDCWCRIFPFFLCLN